MTLPRPAVPSLSAARGAALAIGGLLLVASACNKQLQVKSYQDPLGNDDGAESAAPPPDDGGGSVHGVPVQALDELRANFERVHFEYDSADLTDTTREALDRNAQILLRYPQIVVSVEGHCDDRGSTEYNLALGERRAAAVKDYLVRLGVKEGQLVPVSYGEERPLDPREDTTAWAQNRRVEFVSRVMPR